MAYEWREGDLVTTDDRVDKRLRRVCVSEEIEFGGLNLDESYVLSLMPWSDELKGYFSVEFESEREYNNFKKALAKALVISVGM